VDLTPQLLIYLLVFCGGFLALQAIIGGGRQAAIRVKLANDRLRRMQKDESQTEVLTQMRKDRSLNAEGELKGALIWLNQLVLHSGLPLGTYGIYIALPVFSLSLAVTLFLLKGTLLWAGIGAAIGFVLPIFILRFLVKRRRHKAVTQLPEALDVIVRSLAAGHPVPVAMALVAKEMPDPIGSEFGMVSDEIAFGSQLTNAVQRLAERVGHADFDLFAAMIRLQERTGGNLVQLLRANSDTIRARQKMRLKIKAASAEGRTSAMILNVAPIAVFLLVNLLSPDFYGSVSDNPLVKKTFTGVIIWMAIGNIFMRKMINFKI